MSNAKEQQLTIAQTVQYFITTIDGLQLSLKAVDEVKYALSQIIVMMVN